MYKTTALPQGNQVRFSHCNNDTQAWHLATNENLRIESKRNLKTPVKTFECFVFLTPHRRVFVNASQTQQAELRMLFPCNRRLNNSFLTMG
jgi:hypothetical protein